VAAEESAQSIEGVLTAEVRRRNSFLQGGRCGRMALLPPGRAVLRRRPNIVFAPKLALSTQPYALRLRWISRLQTLFGDLGLCLCQTRSTEIPGRRRSTALPGDESGDLFFFCGLGRFGFEGVLFVLPFGGDTSIEAGPVDWVDVGIENNVVECQTRMARQAKMAS